MDENMARMQQEAAERVREMQRRARLYVRHEEKEEAEEEPRQADSSPCEEERQPEPVCRETLPASTGSSLLSALTGDKERLLLLMLAVLLVNNDADIELVVALLYLAM